MYADFILPKSFTCFGNVPVETAISIQTGSKIVAFTRIDIIFILSRFICYIFLRLYEIDDRRVFALLIF